MMVWLPFDLITPDTSRNLVGGKAFQLAALKRAGYQVPPGGCVPATVYETVLTANGLRERVAMELNRKPFKHMRWEEIWDASLRIRNMFLSLTLPAALIKELHAKIRETFGETEVAVRSSAPAEDSGKASFAGLHESYTGIRGPKGILHHIRLVWASLWSDRALLYRKELGLHVETSKMAVVVQQFIRGDASGVVFSQNPLAADESVVEAVAGQGEDLVSGRREPDRWHIKREDGTVSAYKPAHANRGPTITNHQAMELHHIAMDWEKRRTAPQDVEWTIRSGNISLVQARAITTPPPVEPHGADKRGWYLSLHRSLPELEDLYTHITTHVLPGMEKDAMMLAAIDLKSLSANALIAEYNRRKQINRHWLDAYWKYCIPFAHGMRFFGSIYNERLQPEDPYAFVSLLSGNPLIALKRDTALREIGRMAAANAAPATLNAAIEDWKMQYGMAFHGRQAGGLLGENILQLALRLAGTDPSRPAADTLKQQEARWFQAFSADEQHLAAQLLEIGRASYALRDNDNHYLERIRAQERRAADEIKRRMAQGTAFPPALEKELAQDFENDEPAATSSLSTEPFAHVRGKQMVGQPSSPGTATGKARVIQREQEIFSFQKGEVLIVDAISPSMTFVVPLAAAIVERRGGMLIHGAIIAREYGIPCVTGVAHATRLITTGQTVSVDGYLGLVAVRVDVKG